MTHSALGARDYTEYDYIDIDFHLTLNGWVIGDIRCSVAKLRELEETRSHRTSAHSDTQNGPCLSR